MIFSFWKRHRQLRKGRKVFHHLFTLYRRKQKKLPPQAREELREAFHEVQQALLKKEGGKVEELLPRLEAKALQWLAKSPFEKGRDYLIALAVALTVAVLIRQMWFEFYTIPTGSMRPTLKEGDYLVVSKTEFGLNVPLTTRHFLFEPELVERGAIVVFTGENMEMSDADTTYFYLFPGKKQFVKRLIGKPGDTLYFYGGKIYGIDREGKELKELLFPRWFETLEHIPFLRFEGKIEAPSRNSQGIYTPVTFIQSSLPLARLMVTPFGKVKGELLSQKEDPGVKRYGDFWGIDHFAMARLLTPAQVGSLSEEERSDLSEGLLYLQLAHHPSIEGATLGRDELGRVRPELSFETSLIPLQEEEVEKIAHHLTTARFVVQNGIAVRYGQEVSEANRSYFPRLEGIPDGTYEFFDGTAYEILWGGVSKKLPSEHPLYPKTPEAVRLFFNLGIEWVCYLNDASPLLQSYPSRYAYFREGVFYAMGAPLLEEKHPALEAWMEREVKLHGNAPFTDPGAPLLPDGSLNKELITSCGLKVPEGYYYVLGDNHAMSADSRHFGFVPEENLKGGPNFLFWPPGKRWGRLPQPPHLLLTRPNCAVWAMAFVVGGGMVVWYRRRLRNPLP